MGADHKIQIRLFLHLFQSPGDRGFATLTYDPHDKSVSRRTTGESSASAKKDHDSNEVSSTDDPTIDQTDKSQEKEHESSESNSNSNMSTKEQVIDSKETGSSPSTSSSVSPDTVMSGRHYMLHRDIFEMRLQFHKNLAAQRKTRLLLNSGKGLPSPPSKPLP